MKPCQSSCHLLQQGCFQLANLPLQEKHVRVSIYSEVNSGHPAWHDAGGGVVEDDLVSGLACVLQTWPGGKTSASRRNQMYLTVLHCCADPAQESLRATVQRREHTRDELPSADENQNLEVVRQLVLEKSKFVFQELQLTQDMPQPRILASGRPLG
jgi:hypothetical protein